MNNSNKLEKLQCTFPRLTEANQHYVLGLAEGLKRAQKDKVGKRAKDSKTSPRETNE
jgi:hypothetical protein